MAASPAGTARRSGESVPVAARTVPLGVLGAAPSARIDASGVVTVMGAEGASGWELAWSVAAEDRWHDVRSETAIRQQAVDQMPVTETRLRVPGGDIVQRCFAVAGSRGPALAMEITNETPVPVAIALGVHGGASVSAITQRNDLTVAVGESDAIVFDRPANGSVAVAAGADLWDAVHAEEAERRWVDVRRGSGPAEAAFVFPLPHDATMRVLIGGEPALADIATVPTIDQVVSGWRRRVAEGAALSVGDETLDNDFGGARARLLIEAEAAAARHQATDARALAWGVVGLEAAGDHREAVALLAALTDDQSLRGRFGPSADTTGAALAAMGWSCLLADDGAVGDELVGPMVKAANWLTRGRGAGPVSAPWVTAGLSATLAALHVLDQGPAAERLRDRLGDEAGNCGAPGDPSDLPAAEGAEGSGLVVAATRVLEHRRRLVAEAGDRTEPELHLAPPSDLELVGRALHVVDAPTRAGRVGYAVRWHGERPALLWELDARPGVSVTLRAPGLDSAWFSREPNGEALLAEPDRSAP